MTKQRSRVFAGVVRVALLALAVALVAGCTAEKADETVQVDLTEYSISLDSSTVPQGRVEFAIDNQGAMVHEIEVFAGATDGQVLPVAKSVADTGGLELVDEVEDILPASRSRLTTDLEPGTYLVICNLPDHYEQGMYAFLTVTE